MASRCAAGLGVGTLFQQVEWCRSAVFLSGLSVQHRPTDRKRRPAVDQASPAVPGRPKKNPYTIEVLRRAIEILSAFSHARPAMSLAEIVQAVSLPKTTVFRVLSSLTE